VVWSPVAPESIPGSGRWQWSNLNGPVGLPLVAKY